MNCKLHSAAMYAKNSGLFNAVRHFSTHSIPLSKPSSLPIVHHEGYVCPMPEGHRFPMNKFYHVFDILKKDGLVMNAKGNVFRPTKASWTDLSRVHEQDYLRKLHNLSLSEKEVRKIGLPLTSDVVGRCLRETGGTILAAELALEHGLAASTAGGTHHAFPSSGSGFCLLNDLAVAARCVQARRPPDRVPTILILDLDVHQGDGTAFAFQTDPTVFTFSLHCEQNFPLKKEPSDLDVSVPKGMRGPEYMSMLKTHLPHLLDSLRPDLVLYDAGVDVHQADLLGKLELTSDDIYCRDLYVVGSAVRRGIPCACVIGGGYSADVVELSRRHTLVHRAACWVWSQRHSCYL